MKRFVARVLALLVLAVIVGIGAISTDSGGQSSESASITDYAAAFDVAANGELTALETLKVSFPVPRHGIFRFFDTKDPNHARNRLIPTGIAVTRDGQSEPFEIVKQEHGKIRSVKIGDANQTLSGEHTYQITYRIKGVLTPGSGGARTSFYWNLIPQGWTMPITRSRLTVHLPAAVQSLTCGIGLGAATDPCDAKQSGNDLTVTTGPLAPNTPVTAQVGLDIATPAADTRPWSSSLDPVLSQHPVLLGFVLLVALVLAGGGAALSRSTREVDPAFPLMYAPPEGIGPAQAEYLLTEKVENRTFVATMMYAAERGAVNLAQDGKAWTLTATEKTDVWSQVDPVTQETGMSLGVQAPGSSFSAAPGSVTAGKELKSALSKFDANTKGWAKTSGLMVGSGLGGGGILVLLVAGGLAVYLGAFNPLNMSVLALIPGLFAITALGVGAPGAGTRRTPAGRDLWSRVGGFKRVLSTPSAQDRFDFSGRKELYTQYLPWAVAFDCADEWAKKYRIETGEEPPSPSWLPMYAGVHAGNYVNQMVDSFDSAVSSAISSYNATQSSSSGGGGGFSGGGGGGGGGGGSW